MHSNLDRMDFPLDQSDTLPCPTFTYDLYKTQEAVAEGVLWYPCQEYSCWADLCEVLCLHRILCSLAWLKAASYLVKISIIFQIFGRSCSTSTGSCAA